MKRLIIVAAVVASLVLLFIQSNWVGALFTRAAATLTVQNENIPLALYIDNQLSGTLPLRELSISPGVHTFTLQNIKGENSINVFWQGELEVNPADSVVITVVSTQEKRIDGIVVTRFFSSNSQRSFSRVFMEQKATLYINGEKLEKTPVVLEDSHLSDITVRTENPIYPDIQFSFTKKQGTSFSSHIYLLYDYVQNIVPEEVVSEAATTGTFHAERRWEWQSTPRPLPVDVFGEEQWVTMPVYSIVIPEFMSSEKTLQDIEDQFVNLGYAPRIPFCFVVDPSGVIWEGFGVWGYDFSMLDMASFKHEKGECPVLVIKTTNGQHVAQGALKHIQDFIQRPAQHGALVQDTVESVTLHNRERTLVSVAIQNIGWSTWHPQEGEEIAIVVEGSERSELFDQDNWLEPRTPNRVTDPIIIPGGETVLAIPLRAPMYSLGFEEKFILSVGGTVMPDTIVTVPVHVEGAGSAVEVFDAPSGFLNVYESDSAETKLLASLFNGERHALLEKKGEWSKIRLRDGTDGWVQAQYIRGL